MEQINYTLIIVLFLIVITIIIVVHMLVNSNKQGNVKFTGKVSTKKEDIIEAEVAVDMDIENPKKEK